MYNLCCVPISYLQRNARHARAPLIQCRHLLPAPPQDAAAGRPPPPHNAAVCRRRRRQHRSCTLRHDGMIARAHPFFVDFSLTPCFICWCCRHARRYMFCMWSIYMWYILYIQNRVVGRSENTRGGNYIVIWWAQYTP